MYGQITAIIPALVHIIVCLSWAVNHYRDNAITYKAQRDKKCEELASNAAITDMQMRQRDVASFDAKYTKELASIKLKMMLCVMMLPLVVVSLHQNVCQSVREATTASAWIMQPRLADTAEPGLFHPQKADHYAKTTGRNPEVY